MKTTILKFKIAGLASKGFLLTFIMLALVGCEKDEGPTRLQEYQQYHESYRFYLWNKLIANNYTIDFVGTRLDVFKYPNVYNIFFDRDHQGESGIEAKHVYNNIDRIMQRSNPDVVLLGIGGNDLVKGRTAEETVKIIERILIRIKANNPKAVVFLEQIAPPANSDFGKDILK